MLLGSRWFSSRKRIIKKKKVEFTSTTTKYSITGSSKGVRINKKKSKIMYLTGKKGGRGVRNDNIIYSTPEQKTKHTLRNMLYYSKPCVCGSLLHIRRTHVDCLLNPRYDDI